MAGPNAILFKNSQEGLIGETTRSQGVETRCISGFFDDFEIPKVSTGQVDECSGLAASRINNDLYWVTWT